MKPEVRLYNEDNIFGITKDGGKVEIYADEGWRDVSSAVCAVGMNLVVGEPSRISVTFIVSSAEVTGIFDDGTIEAMADILRRRGWECVAPPEEAAA